MIDRTAKRLARLKKILLASAQLLTVSVHVALGVIDAPMRAQSQSSIPFGATAVQRFEAATTSELKSLDFQNTMNLLKVNAS